MKWGAITWVFLHAVSYQVHSEHYQYIKVSLWNHIKQLCSNLPCPECASHATQYLKQVNVPETKEHFIQFLFTFHNVVNRKLGKPPFSFQEMTKYKTVNLTTAFYACKYAIKSQPYNPKMIMHKMKTQDSLYQFQEWLKRQRMIA